MDYAQEVAVFGTSTSWTSLPSDVQERARDRLLDALSTASGSVVVRVPPWAAAAAAFVDGNSTASGGSTVVGFPGGYSAEAAAFVNGVGVHSLLYEDVSLKSSDHPSAVICPAALAAAEAVDAPRSRLLTAIAVGYETQLALGDLAHAAMGRGFRTTSVFGVVGAAAAGAVIAELSEERFATALALAANVSSGLMQAWAHGTNEPFLHAGAAASLGLLSVRVAQAGAQAAPTTFSGPNGYFAAYAGQPGAVVPPPGPPWQILDISCKPYPISGAKTTAVDSCLDLVSQGVKASDIERIEAWLSSGAITPPGCNREAPYSNVTQAQDAAQFCIAAALAGKPMDALSTFFDEFDDPTVAELSHKISLVPEDGRQLGRIRVHLVDGTTRESEVDHRINQVPTVDSMRRKLEVLSVGLWSPQVATGIGDWVAGKGAETVSTLSDLLRDLAA